MYRTIAKVLVVFLVSANLTWATDLDENGFQGAESRQQTDVDGASHVLSGDYGQDILKDVPCNHCCHGSAHYLGLPYVACVVSADFVCESVLDRLSAPRSRAKDPPQHPPRA